jgi:hypothetical protein
MVVLMGFVGMFALAGCIQTQATMLDPTARPAVPAEEVRVYRTAESIECDYAEVALIHAQGGANFTNENQMIEAAKKRAGTIGANGVVLGTIDEPSAGAKVAGAIFGVSPDRRGEMLAVYVYDPCRPQGTEQAGTADEGMTEENALGDVEAEGGRP